MSDEDVPKHESQHVDTRLIGTGHTFGTVTDKISSIVLTTQTPLLWFAVVGIGALLVGALGMAVTYLFYKGVGIWGVNVPIGWGFAIVNFVWWVGIGHAGTLISAILLLLRQAWRNSINRFAEAMTLFAVMCAECSRCCTWAVHGSRTGCSPTRTR